MFSTVRRIMTENVLLLSGFTTVSIEGGVIGGGAWPCGRNTPLHTVVPAEASEGGDFSRAYFQVSTHAWRSPLLRRSRWLAGYGVVSRVLSAASRRRLSVCGPPYAFRGWVPSYESPVRPVRSVGRYVWYDDFITAAAEQKLRNDQRQNTVKMKKKKK